LAKSGRCTPPNRQSWRSYTMPGDDIEHGLRCSLENAVQLQRKRNAKERTSIGAAGAPMSPIKLAWPSAKLMRYKPLCAAVVVVVAAPSLRCRTASTRPLSPPAMSSSAMLVKS
jgi:hypothetical protein